MPSRDHELRGFKKKWRKNNRRRNIQKKKRLATDYTDKRIARIQNNTQKP
jgi:hypothetical protein